MGRNYISVITTLAWVRFLPDHTGTIHLLFCLIVSTEKVTDFCNSNFSMKKKIKSSCLVKRSFGMYFAGFEGQLFFCPFCTKQ